MQDMPGYIMLCDVIPRYVWLGNVRTISVRLNQVTPGYVRLCQVRTG